MESKDLKKAYCEEEIKALIAEAKKSRPRPTNRALYIYLHTNGNLIMKPGIVVESDPQYFDSPFVAKVWRLEFWDDIEGFAGDVVGKHITLDDFKALFNLRRNG